MQIVNRNIIIAADTAQAVWVADEYFYKKKLF